MAILAALTIFPVVFSFGFSPSQGPGLVFKTLPVLFAKLPGSMFLSLMFFSLFVFTALTSAVPLVEVCATNLMENLSWTRRKATIVVGIATFTFGIPSALADTDILFSSWNFIFGRNFLETIDQIASVWTIPLAGFFTSLFIGYRMKKKGLKEEFYQGFSYKWGFSLWYFAIKVLVPILILAIILQTSGLINISNWI